MIKAFYQEDIIKRFAAVFTYGINEGYSYKSIEEHITYSPFINSLENNEYNIESKIEKVVETTYGVTLDKPADISYKGLFLAESYFKLFLSVNKSFEYLFLYLPLSYLIERYVVYHEMDFSNLKNDFIAKTKEITLLKKLSTQREIKLVDVSKLTGVNDNTIKRYCKNDEYLYGVSHDNIYKLARLFKVKDNIFISSLEVYLDQSVYLVDKTNEDYRNYLGLCYANYFDSRINEMDFRYDKENSYFISGKGIKLIVIIDQLQNISVSKLNSLIDANTYVVFFPVSFFGDGTSFEFLKDINALDIMMVTQEYAYIIKKKQKREITDTVNRSLIILAKEKSLNNISF